MTTPGAAGHDELQKTLIKTLLILSIIWNVIVPALAREEGQAAAVSARLSDAGSGELLRKTADGMVEVVQTTRLGTLFV